MILIGLSDLLNLMRYLISLRFCLISI